MVFKHSKIVVPSSIKTHCVHRASAVIGTAYPEWTSARVGDDVTLSWSLPQSLKDASFFFFYVRFNVGTKGNFIATLIKNKTHVTVKLPANHRIQYNGNISTTGEGVFSLMLKNVQEEDAGRYSCLEGKIILENCGHGLVVLQPPSTPNISISSISTLPGRPVTFECSSSSQSLPSDHPFTLSYTWRMNGGDLQHEHGPYITLHNVTRHDKVAYSCQAIESIEDKQIRSNWSRQLYLYTPPKPILSVDDTVVAGKSLTLYCSSTSLPLDHNLTTNYVWRRNRSTLPDDKTPHKDGSHVTIPKISKEDDGVKYSCQAKEQHGLRSVWSDDVTLDVHYGPIINNFTVNNREMVTVKEGEIINFKCTGDSNPSSVVTFVLDINSPIVPNSTLVPPHGFSSLYTISSVDCSHHGRYYCQVSNSIQTTRSDSIDIEVRCGPRQRDIIRQRTNSSVASWRLSIWAYPMPEENLFFSDQTGAVRSITTGEKYQLKHLSVRENLHDYTFSIENVDFNDFGNYIIMIQNAEGSKNISISLMGEGSVGPVRQEDAPVAITVAPVCSVLFVVAAIGAAVYINRNRMRKKERKERFVSYLSPTRRRLSSTSNESPYATINMEDVSMESALGIRDDYQRLQAESRNHIYRALYPKIEPGKARHHKCSIICGCLSAQCAIVKQ